MAGSPAAVTTAGGANPIPANGLVDHYREHVNFYSAAYQAPIVDPTVPPTLSVGGSGGVPGGVYTCGYTYTNASGETKSSPLVAIKATAGQQITITAPALPSGATGVGFYVSLPDSPNPLLHTAQAGLALVVSTLPTPTTQGQVRGAQSSVMMGVVDDYRSNAYYTGDPIKPLSNRDTTAYPTQVSDDSWIVHIRAKGGTV